MKSWGWPRRPFLGQARPLVARRTVANNATLPTKSATAVNVLIVDDHPMVAEYLAAAVSKALPEAVVRTAGTLEAGLDIAREHSLGLALLDLGLPGLGGIDSVLRFRQAFPDVPVLVVSSNDDPESITGALAVGAAGFVPKSAGPKILLNALRLVFEGGRYIPPEALRPPAAAPAPGPRRPEDALTDRQREVLDRMLKGYSNTRIAQEMGISEATVKQHAHAVYSAFGVAGRVELIVAVNSRKTGTNGN
jgi:DNA-binding NarL/FixJ family response regulator